LKAIVTTTIYNPTQATIKFCEKTQNTDWIFIIVGDTKTPHDKYRELCKKYSGVIYLSPTDQEKLYKKVSDTIGWKCIQRRNIGYIHAYKLGAEIIATVDDDNIPYETWGDNILVGKEIHYDCYRSQAGFFDPLSPTKYNYMWHRGYPIQKLSERNPVTYEGRKTKKVMVQANLWDGDPDIDAMARLTHMPVVRFDDVTRPYGSDQVSPFNSQNTLIHRDVLPHYCVFPHVGRMDDIWGAYVMQNYFPNSVIYDVATVYQDRNEQDLIKNLEDEVIGYRKTVDLVSDLSKYRNILPDNTKIFWDAYQEEMLK